MFVYSLRAGTVKFVGVVCVALTVLITLIAFVPTYGITSQTVAGVGREEGYRYDGVRSETDAAEFLSQFGWQVNGTPVEVKTVSLPTEFDKVFAAYNELQREQGLNLARYKGKEITRYTFAVTNYPDYEGTVYANVLVFRGRVIGGDICSADVSGFVQGFERQDSSATKE